MARSTRIPSADMFEETLIKQNATVFLEVGRPLQ
jgi:hypothetical protein